MRTRISTLAAGIVITVAAVAAAAPGTTRAPANAKPIAFRLRSPAFARNGSIPRVHTCDGADVSPPLAWSGAPARTRSFALVVDDPDAPDPAAPTTIWVHWVVYDLPARTAALPQHVTPSTLPRGAREGLNDWKLRGWRGPCPPRGRHRYFHRLYALDIVLPDLGAANKAALERAMQGHILGTAELVGTYQH